MKLFIKNMVCSKCKTIVKYELDNLGLNYGKIELGEVELTHIPDSNQLEKLKIELLKSGLELMDIKKMVLVEKIKNLIIEMVYSADELPPHKNSEYISQKLQLNYSYLSTIFSEAEGITVEKFIIMHRIEKIKELLIYSDFNLSEISYKLNFSSLAHLCTQFKKITGLPPSFFRQIKCKRVSAMKNVYSYEGCSDCYASAIQGIIS